MASKRFTLLISLRVILLIAAIALLFWLVNDHGLLFTGIFLVILILFQTFELIHFTEKTNRELKKFLDALQYGDYALSFNNKLGGSFNELDESFSRIIETLKTSKAEKQSHSELLKLALENIRLGIIIIDAKGTIILMNEAAQQMLNIPQFHSWDMLKKKKPAFAEFLGNMDFQGRRLIKFETGSGLREFYLDLNHISLLGISYNLISFSDLKNEIEQKEIDAWYKLIRILAHEVMNSVTPVTSLSETIKGILTDKNGQALPPEKLDQEKIDDILLALSTIIRRSQGMLSFVEDYRKLTKLPAPNFEIFAIEELFTDVCRLMKPEAVEQGIDISCALTNTRLALSGDRKMIEQVLINLIGNSIYALEGTENGKIVLSAHIHEFQIIIEVSDNGQGIEEDLLSSIFIPFFSTRKNGTGIGLTLSKNIMKLHHGNINVRSRPGEGTVFTLVFEME